MSAKDEARFLIGRLAERVFAARQWFTRDDLQPGMGAHDYLEELLLELQARGSARDAALVEAERLLVETVLQYRLMVKAWGGGCALPSDSDCWKAVDALIALRTSSKGTP